MPKSLLKWGLGSNKTEVRPTETPSPSPPSCPYTTIIGLLEKRNQRLEAESKVIEERNLCLEAELVVQSKRIDELEKEKEEALRNEVLHEKRGLAAYLLMERNLELQKETKQARRIHRLEQELDLLKERNERLEAEIHADSHLNHTLKVCT